MLSWPTAFSLKQKLHFLHAINRYTLGLLHGDQGAGVCDGYFQTDLTAANAPWHTKWHATGGYKRKTP